MLTLSPRSCWSSLYAIRSLTASSLLVLPLPPVGTVLPVAMLIAYVLSTMKVVRPCAPISPCMSDADGSDAEVDLVEADRHQAGPGGSGGGECGHAAEGVLAGPGGRCGARSHRRGAAAGGSGHGRPLAVATRLIVAMLCGVRVASRAAPGGVNRGVSRCPCLCVVFVAVWEFMARIQRLSQWFPLWFPPFHRPAHAGWTCFDSTPYVVLSTTRFE